MAAPPSAQYAHPESARIGPELRVILICPEERLAAEFRAELRRHEQVELVHECQGWPEDGELARLARVHSPNLVVLSAETPDVAAVVLDKVHRALPAVPVAAIHATCVPDALLRIMRLRVQEFLLRPFRPEDVASALIRLREIVRNTPELTDGTDHVFSFLPAKPGVGATTIALNSAIAASSLTEKPVFLGDFDLNGGITRFILKLDPNSSVVNAALTVDDPREDLWPRFVVPTRGIHVLHSGRLQPDLRAEPWQIRRLVEQIRRRYGMVFADLSGNLEAYSLEIIRQSQRIFVVTTAELPSLYLAREKVQFLHKLYLADSISVLVNRTLKKGLSMEEVSSIVEAPVTASFQNDYNSVSRAIEDGAPVRSSSELGRQFAAFARMLSASEAPQSKRPVRRFLEFFSVPNVNPIG